MNRGTARVFASIACVATVASAGVSAQWLNHRDPSLPRAADGRPNLRAAAPKTVDGHPDLSGIWRAERPLFLDLAGNVVVEMTPWASAVQKQRSAREHVDDPSGYCALPGLVRMIGSTPFKIVQTATLIATLHETAIAPIFRQVHLDGRALPVDPAPTWLGYSVARWEGETLVVESSGFNDGGWLDTGVARPNSDALHVTEKWHRIDVGHMDLALTIDDPKAYVKPWTVDVRYQLMPDTELLEGSCDSHMKTMEHRRVEDAPPEPPSSPVPNR